MIIDPENGSIYDANKSALKYYGYTKDEIQNMTIQQINCLYPSEIKTEIKKAKDNSKVYFKFKHRLANGEVRDVDVFSNSIILNEKKYLHSIIIDVTEKMKLENDLKKSTYQNSLLSAVVKNSDDIVVIKDLDFKVLATNQAFANASGHKSVETMIGKTDAEIFGVSPESEPVKSYMQDELAAQKLQKGEYIFKEEPVITSSGEKKIVLTKKYPIFNDNNKLIATGNISVDITELKKTADSLKDVIEGTNLGTWEWNVQTGAVVFNERWAQIIGYTLKELEPISIETWIKHTHPEDLKRSNEMLEKHFRGEIDFYDIEVRMKHKNGEWIWVQDTGQIKEYTSDGKPLMVFGTHQETTQQHEYLEKIKYNQNLLNSILKVIPGSLNVVDKDYNLILSNKEQYLLNTEDAKNNQGTKCFKAYHHRDEPCTWCNIENVFKTGNEYSEITDESDPRSAITGIIWKITNKPLYDENNNIIGAIEYGTDITDIKNSEKKAIKALKEKELLVKELLILQKAAYSVLQNTNFEETAEKLFSYAKEISNAKSGYVALLNDEGDENEIVYLDAGGLPCTVNPNLPMYGESRN